MEIVIVTGLSGAGKSQALNVFEDAGYFCIDNMPPSLIARFAELCKQSKDKITKAAIGVDVRGRDMFSGLEDCLKELEEVGYRPKILFLDASNAVLERRFKESRRKHPLISSGSDVIEDAIENERRMLRPLFERADYYVDTSNILPAQLKDRVTALIFDNGKAPMIISFMSFGFKYGLPPESDLVFDVRCLPNPFYIPELKNLSGLDKPVQDYVIASEDTEKMLKKLEDLILFSLPLYEKEGKSQVVVSIGCTGGRHRSVYVAEYLNEKAASQGYLSKSIHRDINKNF